MNAPILKHTQKNCSSQLFLENELLLSPLNTGDHLLGGRKDLSWVVTVGAGIQRESAASTLCDPLKSEAMS